MTDGQQPEPRDPKLDVQHVWYEMRRDLGWRTLAVVADPGVSAASLVHDFGVLAARETGAKVLVVEASVAGCPPGNGQAPQASGDTLWARLLGSSRSRDPSRAFDEVRLNEMALPLAHRVLGYAPLLVGKLHDQEHYNTSIFWVDSPLIETRASPLLRAVERVAVCVKMGVTRSQDAKRLLEIIGEDKIIGSVLLR